MADRVYKVKVLRTTTDYKIYLLTAANKREARRHTKELIEDGWFDTLNANEWDYEATEGYRIADIQPTGETPR